MNKTILSVLCLVVVMLGQLSTASADRWRDIANPMRRCGGPDCHGDAKSSATFHFPLSVNIRSGSLDTFNVLVAHPTLNSAAIRIEAIQSRNQIKDVQMPQLDVIPVKDLKKPEILDGVVIDDDYADIVDDTAKFVFSLQGKFCGFYYLDFDVMARDRSNRQPSITDAWRSSLSIPVTIRGALLHFEGDSVFCRGDTASIFWRHAGYTQFRLEISSDSGATWKVLLPLTPASYFTHQWVVPQDAVPSDKYLIRLIGTEYDDELVTVSPAFTILPPPVVTSQPPDTAACLGEPFTLRCAVDRPDGSYQWRKNGVPIAGATSASYTIASVRASDAGSYSCVVDACGRVTTRTATVRVVGSPRLTRQPRSRTACTGDTLTLSTAATGEGVGYQWYRNGNPIENGRTATLAFQKLSWLDEGRYHCEVSGFCAPPVSTDTVTLSLRQGPEIFAQTKAVSVPIGSRIAMGVRMIGTIDGYQWTKNGRAIAGATTDSLIITPATVADTGRYVCLMTSDCGSLPSQPIRVNVFTTGSEPNVEFATGPLAMPSFAVCERPAVRIADVIRSTGGSVAVVTGMRTDAPARVRIDSTAFPMDIPPGTGWALPFTAVATSTGPWEASIVVETNLGDQDYQLTTTVQPAIGFGADTIRVPAGTERCFALNTPCSSVQMSSLGFDGDGSRDWSITRSPRIPTTVRPATPATICVRGTTGARPARVVAQTTGGAATAVIMEGTVVSVTGEAVATSRVVPMPAGEEWSISFDRSQRRISIVDVTGAIRWTMAPSPEERMVLIGTAETQLPAGTYTVVLDGDHGTQVLPLVIVR
jgi:hypothetical protein